MASVFNAFDLLKGAAGQQVASGTNKKKKPKPRIKPADAQLAADAAQTTAGQKDDIVEQADAWAILEKSARIFKSGGDRIKLWKDWVRQAGDRSNKALKYQAPDGRQIPFKELVLCSRALEITVESCVTSPLTAEQTSSLQQLLATFLPRVDPAALASAIARLGELLAEDTQSFDTIGAAQRAVHNVIGTLKVAREDAEPASKPASLYDRLAAIDREASKQQGFLASVEKLAAINSSKPALAVSSSGISKAHVDSAKELVQLFGEKFDLLQPNGAAVASQKQTGSGPNQATIKYLEELKDVIGNHLKEARGLEESVKGTSKEAQQAQAVAALRREETVLAQQASEIAGQIRVLESQLAQLRGQAAEIEDKRVRLQQRQAAALEALGQSTGRKLPGLSAQHYHEELSATDQLLQLVDPSRTAPADDQLAAAQEEHGSSAAQAYMAAMRNFMQMCSTSLADVPKKVVFCRERIAQAEKLSSLGGLGKEKSAKTREEAEKLLTDSIKHCEEMMLGAHTALDGMRSRFPAFSPEQQQQLSQAAYEIEDMMSHIHGQYELAMASVHGPPAGIPTEPAQRPLFGTQLQQQSQQQPGGLPGAQWGGAASLLNSNGLPTAASGGPVGSLGPIMPPSAGLNSALVPVASSNGHAAAPTAAAAAAKPAPAAAAPPPSAAPAQSADGFQQVGGKKGRRRA